MARILIGNIKPTLVNNALTTQAGLYALDAAMGYTLDDKIGKVSSDLANLSGLENLTVLTDSKSWQAANGIHFALWGANTLGTPYKQNLTSVSAGIQIGGRVSENNQFWISIDANGKMYKTYYDRGTDAWSQWTAI